MLVSAIILALYFWAYISALQTPIASALLVNDAAAATAGAALLTSVVSYLWAPQKYAFWGSYAAFLLLSTLAALLIINTGGTTSPFVALWMLIAVFAGVFGWYGLAPLLIASVAYLILQAVSDTLTRDVVVAVVLIGELPLVISYMIWHTKSAGDSGSERAYRQLATELSQVANKSEVVINAIADGVVALNAQGVIQLINPAAQQIIGWGKQDALALDYKSVVKLLDKDGHEASPAIDPVAEVLTTNKQIVTNELGLLTNSEKKLLISMSVSPVGQLGSGVIIVFRDITNEKAEEREQAEFISTASHEMRTPVATIEGYLGLALNPATAQIDDKARDFIAKAHESAQHLGRLFSDLLDISKAEDGRLKNTPKVVNVAAFVQDVTQGLQPQAQAKGLRMLFKPQPDNDERGQSERHINPVYYAEVDNDHLREVVSNLIENAIKYTPKGDVTVDIGGDTTHITISVADSGIGIPKEDQSHLFQKFYRVDNTDTREIGGTGLGLYLSRRLAETMGGRIWVDSEYRQGSTFYLELPRISHEDAMQAIETVNQPTVDPEIMLHPQQAPIEEPHFQAQTPASLLVDDEENVQYTPISQPQVGQSAPSYQPQQVSTQPAQPAQQSYQAQPAYQPIPPATAQQPATTYQQQVVAPQPMRIPQPAQNYTNTPLSNIEQNPGQYTRQATNPITVPPRQQQ